MNIESRKILFIQEYLKVDNEKIINAVEEFFYKTKAESLEDDLKPMSMEKFHNEINHSLEDVKNGRVINVDKLKEKVKKWS